MRVSTSVGFALLIIGFMLFGFATFPSDSPVSSAISPSCPPNYEVNVIEKSPSPEVRPIPQEYDMLTLSEQEAFQLALLKNGSTTLEEPVFTNDSRVYYQGTVYDVNSTELSVNDCTINSDSGFSWHLGVFALSLLASLGGIATLTRSLWKHL